MKEHVRKKRKEKMGKKITQSIKRKEKVRKILKSEIEKIKRI